MPKVVPSGSWKRSAGAASRPGSGAIVAVDRARRARISRRETTASDRPVRRAADVHVLDEPHFGAHALPNSIRSARARRRCGRG